MMSGAPSAQSADASATVTIYTTAQDSTQRLARTGTATLQPGHALTEVENSVFVDPTRKFQALLGIGGAITDSTVGPVNGGSPTSISYRTLPSE